MITTQLLVGGKVSLAFWILILLGSCTSIHYSVNDVSITMAPSTAHGCEVFEIEYPLYHERPRLPDIDITKLSQREIIEILITYAEDIEFYLDSDESLLIKALEKHRESCPPF